MENGIVGHVANGIRSSQYGAHTFCRGTQHIAIVVIKRLISFRRGNENMAI